MTFILISLVVIEGPTIKLKFYKLHFLVVCIFTPCYFTLYAYPHLRIVNILCRKTIVLVGVPRVNVL